MGLVEKVGAGLNGLDQLRALMSSEHKQGILASLDIELVEVSLGKAVFAGNPGEHAYNPPGTVHGGYVAILLDSACGCAVHSRLTAEHAYTTLEMKISYHKTITKDTGYYGRRAMSCPRGGEQRLQKGDSMPRRHPHYWYSGATPRDEHRRSSPRWKTPYACA